MHCSSLGWCCLASCCHSQPCSHHLHADHILAAAQQPCLQHARPLSTPDLGCGLPAHRYALNIGLAFQVIDDILDVTQTSEVLGKTAAKDLTSNKTTYPKLLGIDKSKEVSALAAAAANLVHGAEESTGHPVCTGHPSSHSSTSTA
jgi:hypothetical protein